MQVEGRIENSVGLDALIFKDSSLSYRHSKEMVMDKGVALGYGTCKGPYRHVFSSISVIRWEILDTYIELRNPNNIF